jgi:TonB family protein
MSSIVSSRMLFPGLLVALAAAVMANSADAQNRVIRWKSVPNGGDIQRAHPIEAQRADVEGEVVMLCKVAPSGRFDSCTIISAEPTTYPFDKGALGLAPRFKIDMKKSTVQAGDELRIPVHFKLPRW